MDLTDFFYGVISSIIASIIILFFVRSKAFFFLIGYSHMLAMRLRKDGIIAFQLRREHYRECLPTFLSHADHSIAIISISLKVSEDEGELSTLFRKLIAKDANFQIDVSLLDPNSLAAKIVAVSLNLTFEQLKEEICSMLKRLAALRNSLPDVDKPRLRVLVHESLPMGSAMD